MTACPVCNRRAWYGHASRCPGPRALPAAEQVAWFERTGHCGACGQPAAWCLCTDARPCGCRELHAMGAGIGADPAVVFAAPVADDQPGLF